MNKRRHDEDEPENRKPKAPRELYELGGVIVAEEVVEEAASLSLLNIPVVTDTGLLTAVVEALAPRIRECDENAWAYTHALKALECLRRRDARGEVERQRASLHHELDLDEGRPG